MGYRIRQPEIKVRYSYVNRNAAWLSIFVKTIYCWIFTQIPACAGMAMVG